MILYPSSGGGGRERWSSLDTSWIFRFRFPPFSADSVEPVAGCFRAELDLSSTGSCSVELPDSTERAALGDSPSSCLGFLEVPTGVLERDDPGLESGEAAAAGLFHCPSP